MRACWSCGHPIDDGDRYCRQCGQGQGAWLPWYYRPVWIALLGLTALGPFVLPLVWRSPRLSRTEKWIMSAIVVVVFAYVGVEIVAAVRELGRVLAEV